MQKARDLWEAEYERTGWEKDGTDFRSSGVSRGGFWRVIEAKMILECHMQDDPEHAQEYEALDEEFAFMKKMILARKRAGMSQADVPLSMGIS